ncbi:transposase [Weissella hellenica]|uniref:transposase n=1 Tax=Weissella hellenica TaxID=46256 RepID=UPI00352809E7
MHRPCLPQARMWISVIASNLMRLMKSIALDDQQQSWTINTFRDRLLKIGGRVSLSTPAR